MTDRPLFSVVVPTWQGSAPWLAECLEGIAAQRTHRPQVIVVFDGPADECQGIARTILPGARQLPFKEQRGFACAASAGLRAARGQLVGLLNDDAVPRPDWLEAMAVAAERHPDVGSFASRVLRADDPATIDSAGHGLARWGEAFAIGGGQPDGPSYRAERAVFGAPACAAVYRWELLRDCGAFDPEFVAYLEDVDLSLRAQLSGFSCRYIPDARVVHRGSASYGWGRGDGHAEGLVARNRVRLLLKSMPRNTLRAGALAAVASLVAELGYRTVTARHAGPVAAGLVAGIRDARSALAARGAALGGRRVDDEAIGRVLKESERLLAELDGGTGRRLRRSLAVGLARSIDRRERRLNSNPFEE